MNAAIAVGAAVLLTTLVAREVAQELVRGAGRAQHRRPLPALVDIAVFVLLVTSALLFAPTLWALLT